VPTQHSLLPIHPNPFRLAFDKAVAIAFELYEATHAKLEIFNILGQHVITLVDDEFEAGTQNISWFGRNSQDQPVYTGVYLYRLETTRQISTRKLVVYR
jgi:flagellar hook assembly protein FlgD